MIDTKLRQELDLITASTELEDILAEYNEDCEIRELLDTARLRGDNYGQGYYEAFWAGRELLLRYQEERSKSLQDKHTALNKRWGLDNL